MTSNTLTCHACTGCGRAYPPEELSDNGLCLSCWGATASQRAYRQAHKGEGAADQGAYYLAHKGEVAAYQRAYYLAHKGEVAASQRAYRQAHKGEKAAKAREYYL